MAILKSISCSRLASHSLTMALFLVGPVLGQTSVPGTANSARDPHVAEVWRRTALSHRRRQEQMEQNAKMNQLLAAETTDAAETPKRPRHRTATMHRALTPAGRKAVRPAAVRRVRQ
jgi:hypothetical protein